MARKSRGLAYTKLGRYELAISDYNYLLKAIPDWSAVLYARGVARLKSGDASGGRADMAKAHTQDAHVDDDFKEYGIEF
jgi:tetratricopeptide (TPR) repeat protein